MFRTVSSWVEVLYALNNRYLMNEKGSLKVIADLDNKPSDMKVRVEAIYKLFAEGEAKQAYLILELIQGEVQALLENIEVTVTEIG